MKLKEHRVNEELKLEQKESPRKSVALRKASPLTEVYLNKSLMDRYIDSFWMINCPTTYSLREVEAAVRTLIKNIMKYSH